MIYYLISFQKPSSERIVITQAVDFSFIDISVERVTGLENDADETIWINIRARCQTFLLCNAYRPEWTDSEYWTRLSHAIGMGYQVNDNILILGDSNSDLFIELDHSNTLLDHIIVSDTINYIYCNVLKEPSEISNHDASEAFLRVLLVHLSGKSGYMIVNKQIFIEKLETVDWINLLCPFDDVDDMCNQFTKIFLELARKCISTKTITVRSNNKLWFTSEIGE